MQSITEAKFLLSCSNRGSAGPSEKVATPATDCEVELLEGRRIISNELETKRRARENIGDENGRGEGERETFTKAPGIGLVERDDPRRSRESRREGAKRESVTTPKLPVLMDQGQGTPPRCTRQTGRPRRGPKTIVADLVGPTPKEKRQRTPEACTASRAI